jgi:hypothetical protein
MTCSYKADGVEVAGAVVDRHSALDVRRWSTVRRRIRRFWLRIEYSGGGDDEDGRSATATPAVHDVAEPQR